MIITLKGADFSTNNIGQLDMWSIFTTLGAGATYSGVKMVDKNAAYTGVITLADGYELGSAGVTVTMGGTALTEGITIDGSTITIEIASVTGTVYISVPTKNTATGEEDGGSEDGHTNITSLFTWTEGGPLLFATGTVGGFGAGANFMYSDFIDISAYTTLKMTICARTGTSATGGWAFYTENAESGFISEGSAERNGNGASTEGSEVRTITIPTGAKYIRTTYWNAMLPHEYATQTPFSCYAS